MTSPRRILVMTLNAAGNWPPERALTRALVERGHDVCVVSDASHAADVEAVGARYRPYRHAANRDPAMHREGGGEPEIVRVWREIFVNPLYGDELLDAVEREAPDVLLVDQMLLAAAAGAESTRLPYALLWHTVFRARAGGAQASAPAVLALDSLNELRRRLGLDPVASGLAIAERANAILAFTYASFDAPSPDPPATLHYVGPLACLPEPPPPYDLPWARDDARPLVLVSYSTSFQNQIPTLQRIAAAVANLPIRVLATLGAAVRASDLSLPDNVTAARFVPHGAVLPQARLVVTHAGHGTVMAAVTAGVPMLCTPMGRDQFAVATCVERCGLGAVLPADAPPETLRSAIAAALDDEALRERAHSFASRLDLRAGLRRALEVIERL